MKYSAKLSKICQQLLDGKSIGTVRTVATHENLCGDWYEVNETIFDDGHALKRSWRRKPWPVAMVMRADRTCLAFAFVGLTEEQACEELLQRSSRKKSPPIAGLKADVRWIRNRVKQMRLEEDIEHEFSIDQMLSDEMVLDDVPCVFREQVRRVRSFLGRYPEEERIQAMNLLLVDEVQNS